ncbi:MAG: glycosyltransferase family 9 protein [Bdellovibrionota bacterium]|nr:glycosyltransferase family 9 protein [Bdellovibrionota bacterium]
MKRVLIIQTAFIGDVILATGLIESVRASYPEAKIDFLLRKGNESLLKHNPHLNEVLIWDKSKGKFKNLISLLFQVRKNKYDLVLNIQRFFNAGLLCGLSGAKLRVGFHSNPLAFLFSHQVHHKIPHPAQDQGELGFFHEVQRNHQLLTAITNESIPSDKSLRPKLYFSDTEKNKIQDLGLNSPYYVLAPSSVWYTKQWHESKWKELIQKLKPHGEIILIGGPDDKAYLDGISTDVTNLAGKLNLLDSAYLMAGAKRVFVNDSAPLHLASSVNAKTTAIFCSTVPDFGYYPLADDSLLVQRERLDCMPCGLHGKKECPQGHFKCALEVDVDAVTQRSF